MGASFVRSGVRGNTTTRIVDAAGGGTDTTLMDAVNNLSSSGGTILIREGTYNFTGSFGPDIAVGTSANTITNSNITIIGSGPATKIGWNITLFGTPSQFRALTFSGCSKLYFSDILFDDTGIDSNSNLRPRFIEFDNCSDIIFENCWFANHPFTTVSAMITFSGCERVDITSSFFLNNSFSTSTSGSATIFNKYLSFSDNIIFSDSSSSFPMLQLPSAFGTDCSSYVTGNLFIASNQSKTLQITSTQNLLFSGNILGDTTNIISLQVITSVSGLPTGGYHIVDSNYISSQIIVGSSISNDGNLYDVVFSNNVARNFFLDVGLFSVDGPERTVISGNYFTTPSSNSDETHTATIIGNI